MIKKNSTTMFIWTSFNLVNTGQDETVPGKETAKTPDPEPIKPDNEKLKKAKEIKKWINENIDQVLADELAILRSVIKNIRSRPHNYMMFPSGGNLWNII